MICKRLARHDCDGTCRCDITTAAFLGKWVGDRARPSPCPVMQTPQVPPPACDATQHDRNDKPAMQDWQRMVSDFLTGGGRPLLGGTNPARSGPLCLGCVCSPAFQERQVRLGPTPQLAQSASTRGGEEREKRRKDGKEQKEERRPCT